MTGIIYAILGVAIFYSGYKVGHQGIDKPPKPPKTKKFSIRRKDKQKPMKESPEDAMANRFYS